MDLIEKKNYEAMRKGFPELYERISSGWKEEKSDGISGIEVMETLTDIPALVVEMEDGRIYRLNSAYDPVNEAEFWAEGQKNLEVSNLFIFGLGNGVFAKAVLRHISGRTKVVIYEPSWKVFRFALQHFDLTFCFETPGVRLIVEGVNDDLFAAVMETMLDVENCEDYYFVLCPKMNEMFPDSRKMLVERYARDGLGWIHSVQMTERARIYISPYNLLHNLQFLKKNTVVPRLKEVMPKDVPVLLIGAGPSLKEEIEVLRGAKGRAFLFAADSALPFLLKEDVLPDAYICVEADKPLWFFEDERTKDIPVFVKMESTHQLLDSHRSTKIFGWDAGFAQRIYRDYGVPESEFRYGANGMTALFSICDEIGMQNVIFIGQDMCYGDDRHTHVGKRDEGFVENNLFLYENNEGKKVQSRLDWARFIHWYENAVIDCGMEHVINSCLRGAKIQGTEVMPLTEALNLYGKPHEELSSILQHTRRTFEGARAFDAGEVYRQSLQEWEKMQQILQRDPRSEERKQFRLYELLRKYEFADPEGDFLKSQERGMEKLREYIGRCIEEEQGGQFL